MAFYFERFEHRRPPEPVPHSDARELLWQFLATVALVLGAWYLHWRWTVSLNPDALWFAIPLVTAETLAYIGLVLFTINLWKTEDVPMQPAPRSFRDVVDDPDVPERPVSVDVFIATYNEDVELVRLSVRDAKAIERPNGLDLRVHVLDDGRRAECRRMAEEEGVGYLDRPNNIGFKAGNLRNAMERTSGDFLLICDADTRPFPTILSRTLGYFRDPRVAWVQTPQWFYDLPEGTRLPDWLGAKLGGVGRAIGRGCEALIGPVRIGADPLVNDPALFYDVIQRRRNWVNAAFCCGAGSIHRREAVMEASLKAWSRQVSGATKRLEAEIKDPQIRRDFGDVYREQAALATEVTPYKFHVSEDIYTSIVLHSDRERRWRSVYHPFVESRMLSPQDLQSWMVQRFKYAGGTLDIAVHDNPVFMPGMSLGQRLMYGATIWGYLAAIWNLVFLLAPILYLFTGISPVAAWNLDFFIHALPFMFMNELATMVGTWGIAGYKGKANYLAFFPVNLRALWVVMRGEKIKFPTTPKERQTGNFFPHVRWQAAIAAATALGLVYGIAGWAFGLRDDTFGLIANLFWGANNIAAMAGMVAAAFWVPDDDEPAEADPPSAATPPRVPSA